MICLKNTLFICSLKLTFYPPASFVFILLSTSLKSKSKFVFLLFFYISLLLKYKKLNKLREKKNLKFRFYKIQLFHVCQNASPFLDWDDLAWWNCFWCFEPNYHQKWMWIRISSILKVGNSRNSTSLNPVIPYLHYKTTSPSFSSFLSQVLLLYLVCASQPALLFFLIHYSNAKKVDKKTFK